MPNQKIVDYIKNAVAQGYQADHLRSHLINNRFKAEEVDEAIKAASSPSSQSAVQASAPIQISKKSVPAGVKVISILYYLGATLLIIFGLLLIFVSLFMGAGTSAVSETVSDTQIAGMVANILAVGSILFIIVAIISIIWAVLSIIIGIGLWRARKWARIVAIMIGMLGILSSFGFFVIESYILGILFMIYYLVGVGYLIFSKKVKEAFA